MQRKTPSDKHLRENYEDHSHRFLDWSHRLGLEKSWIVRILLAVEERFQVRRFALVFLYTIVLAWTLNFEIRNTLSYQVGEVAKSDHYSPVSFEMVDEVTTEEKRVRAEGAVPPIFDYDPSVFDRVSGSVYRSFRLMRSQVRAVKWPKGVLAREEAVKEFFIHKGEFEKELGTTVPDYLFEWLVQNQFAARIENVVIRNLGDWYLGKIAENIEKSVPAKNSMVLARTLQKNGRGKEFSVAKREVLDAGTLESFELQNRKGMEKAQLRDVQNALAFSRLLIFPNLTLNKQEMESRRNLARNSVLPITVSIKKNQLLLGEGTVVQPFHMAMLKEIEALRSDSRHKVMVFSVSLLLLGLLVVFFQYLRRFTQGRVKVANKDIFVMSLILLSVVLIVKIFLFVTETAILTKFGSILSSDVFLYSAPVAAAPMLVGLLITSGEVVWLFSAFMAITMGVMTDFSFGYLIYTLAGGIAAARGVYSCKTRNDLYFAGVRTGAVNALVVVLIVTITKLDQGDYFQELVFSAPAGFLGGVFSSLVAMMMIPLLESVFNYTTDVKLLELSNLNHPLLKEMIVKAPGTYHHSMLVGSMVEAAAEEIGANPLLGKVMCYYHDIGKMEHANYFIENQRPGHNPHDHLSPYMSKTLLIAHVKDGVELGMKYQLGAPIIDGILQHHGTTLISYFYNKAIDLRSEDDGEIPEDEFRYPGPKPQFREAALCMLADSIEAASRSLDEPTPIRLQNIVRNIVQRKFMEGQLDECSLTLKDLSRVEAAFARILLGIYHQRIDYPRAAGGGAAEAPRASLFQPSGNGER